MSVDPITVAMAFSAIAFFCLPITASVLYRWAGKKFDSIESELQSLGHFRAVAMLYCDHLGNSVNLLADRLNAVETACGIRKEEQEVVNA